MPAGIPPPPPPSPSPAASEYALHQSHESHKFQRADNTVSSRIGGPQISGQPMTSPSSLVIEAPPVLEVQPWVKNFARWFSSNTRGVARVDLRRPQPPSPHDYTVNDGNLLVMRRGRGGRSSQPSRPPAGSYRDGSTYSEIARELEEQKKGFLSNPLEGSGARVKVHRSFLMFKHAGGGRPLFDLGVGFSVDMDKQEFSPVARLKIKDWISIKAVPFGVIKICKTVPLFKTGMSLKVHYEVPLQNAQTFWEPPARLMVRLEGSSGSGIQGFHFTPTGVEFDEKLLRFSDSLSMRASAGLTFPRNIPIDPENDKFGLKVHRLSIKTIW